MAGTTSLSCSRRLPTVSGESRDTWARAFVDVMGRVADGLTPRPLHEQLGGFYYYGANFHHALGEAERLGMDAYFAALTQALAAYAQNISNYEAAVSLFDRLADHHSTHGNQEGEAAAYHQLGRIAQELGHTVDAVRFFESAESLFVCLDDPHCLGIVRASLQRVRPS